MIYTAEALNDFRKERIDERPVTTSEFTDQNWVDGELNNIRTSQDQLKGLLAGSVVPRMFWQKIYNYFKNGKEVFHFERNDSMGIPGGVLSCSHDKQLVEIICYVETGKNYFTDEILFKRWSKTFSFVELMQMQ